MKVMSLCLSLDHENKNKKVCIDSGFHLMSDMCIESIAELSTMLNSWNLGKNHNVWDNVDHPVIAQPHDIAPFVDNLSDYILSEIQTLGAICKPAVMDAIWGF